MSTKIYTAYRIPKDQLLHFTDHVRSLVFERAADFVEGLMGCVEIDVARRVPELVKSLNLADGWLDNGGERFNRLTYAFRLVLKVAKTGVAVSNLCSWMNCWPDEKYWYIVPEYPFGVKVKLEDLPEYVSDYSYWNNVDMPEDVSLEEWTARENKWTELCLDDHNGRRFLHTMIGTGPFDGLEQIERIIADRGPWPDERTTGFGAACRADCIDPEETNTSKEKTHE